MKESLKYWIKKKILKIKKKLTIVLSEFYRSAHHKPVSCYNTCTCYDYNILVSYWIFSLRLDVFNIENDCKTDIFGMKPITLGMIRKKCHWNRVYINYS